MIEQNDKAALKIWLLSGYVLVLTMVAVGGITRLTGSGLSIVKWKIVTGAIPPLSESEWLTSFEEYKETPQFRQINKTFALSDYKGIYWWEYFHRLLGRIIGLVFLIPFTFFLTTRKLPPWLIRRLILILILGGLQGLMGWIMVKSGLADLPYVSHYRLATHLGLALLLTGVIYQTYLLVNRVPVSRKGRTTLIVAATTLLFIQITLGAFVAALKAGFYYNTFPLMGGRFMPNSLFSSLENGVAIQFLHRWFAFVFLGSVVLVCTKLWNRDGSNKAVLTLLSLSIFQVVLGILTLVFKVPIILGVSHQILAFLIFTVLVRLLYANNAHGRIKIA